MGGERDLIKGGITLLTAVCIELRCFRICSLSQVKARQGKSSTRREHGYVPKSFVVFRRKLTRQEKHLRLGHGGDWVAAQPKEEKQLLFLSQHHTILYTSLLITYETSSFF